MKIAVIEKIKRREGNELPVSSFIEMMNGNFKCGTSKLEKRKIKKAIKQEANKNVGGEVNINMRLKNYKEAGYSNKDIENMKKPVTDVGNFFKKVTGQEIEPAQPMSKEEKILEKRVQKNKEKEEQENSIKY